jgi:hypothetical protein
MVVRRERKRDREKREGKMLILGTKFTLEIMSLLMYFLQPSPISEWPINKLKKSETPPLNTAALETMPLVHGPLGDISYIKPNNLFIAC